MSQGYWLITLIFGTLLAIFGLGGLSIHPMAITFRYGRHPDPIGFSRFARTLGGVFLILGILCMIVGGLGYRGLI